MILISPVTVELSDSELITIQRALERWSGMDDELAQLIGAVAETGSTFTLATKATIKGADLIEAECPNPAEIADLLTDRQRTALADAIAKIERVCDTDVPTDLSDDAWWVRLSPHESRRPERGSDLDAIVIVEDWLARVSIDVYGRESVSPASWDWLNNNPDDEEEA